MPTIRNTERINEALTIRRIGNDKDWMNAVTEEEGEELYSRIVGYPLEICEMMHEEGRGEEAVANLFYLLEKMGELYKSNPDLFENKTGSLVPKMELMMWWLTELYFIVKGNPAVNDDIKSDMDFFLMDLQLSEMDIWDSGGGNRTHHRGEIEN